MDVLEERIEKEDTALVVGAKFIVTKIGNEYYGINIQNVDNIVRMQRITRVPKAQPYFKGVINIRGDVVPVMSIRSRFHLEPDEYTHVTRIIIIKLESQGLVGIIVDEVKEIITLAEEDIERPSFQEEDERIKYLYGIGKKGNDLISLLDITKVIIDKENS